MRKLVQSDETKKELTTQTKNILLVVYPLFLSLPNKGSTFSRMTILAKTFGLKEPRLRDIFKDFVAGDFETKRKEQSNKGKTIFNSEKKRKSTFTVLNMFQKQRVYKFCDDPSWLDEVALKTEFKTLHKDNVFTYQMMTEA